MIFTLSDFYIFSEQSPRQYVAKLAAIFSKLLPRNIRLKHMETIMLKIEQYNVIQYS